MLIMFGTMKYLWNHCQDTNPDQPYIEVGGDFSHPMQFPIDYIPFLGRSIIKAGYPIKFVNSVISSFINNNSALPPRDINKMRVLINLPFCPENEKYAKLFLSKLSSFTENKYTFLILWKTRKLRSLFPTKG